jgi:hypothetical protein
MKARDEPSPNRGDSMLEASSFLLFLTLWLSAARA